MTISELTNRNLIENRRTPQGLDSLRRTLSISPEQEEVLRNPVHEKCNYTSPQFMEIDNVSNATIPEVATDLGTPEINDKRQIEKCSSEGTQTDFPEIGHSSSFAKIEEIPPKVLRVEANLSTLKSHVECELSDMNRKMESLTNSASNGFHCQSCENLKENLNFLQKELLTRKFYKVITTDSNSHSKLTIKLKIEACILVIIKQL